MESGWESKCSGLEPQHFQATFDSGLPQQQKFPASAGPQEE